MVRRKDRIALKLQRALIKSLLHQHANQTGYIETERSSALLTLENFRCISGLRLVATANRARKLAIASTHSKPDMAHEEIVDTMYLETGVFD